MLYFKHSDLTDKYHVSLKTVHNWVDATKSGKLHLKLHKIDGRVYIANTSGNLSLLEHLAKEGKKYRNTRFHKTVNPVAEFYDLFSRIQVLDIISNLSIHREIPRQYNYFDGGANNWDRFAQRMWKDETPNLLKSTTELIQANFNSLDLLVGNNRINVIDIGPGNALPVRGLLLHLLERGLLHRYIAIDISKDMLHIAKRNIEKWYGNKVLFEGYVRDITFERFDDLLVDDMLDKSANHTINLALLLGATPMNFRSPGDALKVIYSSLGHKDILIYTDKPDSEAERRYFDFNPLPGSYKISPNHRLMLDLLGIDESLYDVVMGFNELKRVRYIQIKLKTALTIKFKFESGERSVDFDKGEVILLWRAWHMRALEIATEFEKVGFIQLQSSLTKDRQYLLTISGIEAKSALEN